jgi:putative Ca2+/H+ antiporter (TMEM165/GDT1 family)
MLAMAFATEYSLEKVLAGIFIGVLLNHGIAVALGNYISSLIPISTIQIFAGFLFVVFALWMFLAIVKYNFWQSKIQLPAPS